MQVAEIYLLKDRDGQGTAHEGSMWPFFLSLSPNLEMRDEGMLAISLRTV